MVHCPVTAALNVWFYCLRGKCQNKNFCFLILNLFFGQQQQQWRRQRVGLHLHTDCCVKSNGKNTTTRHSPLSGEFILCGDNEISFPIPPLLQMKWPLVTWAGFPQKTPELRALLFLCKPDRQWWCYCPNAFGKLGFRWVSVCVLSWGVGSGRDGKICVLRSRSMTHRASRRERCVQTDPFEFSSILESLELLLLLLLLLLLQLWGRLLFLFQTTGSSSCDWWGQPVCNELVSYFEHGLLNAHQAASPCVFRGPTVRTGSFEGSRGAAWPHVLFRASSAHSALV